MGTKQGGRLGTIEHPCFRHKSKLRNCTLLLLPKRFWASEFKVYLL